MQSAWMLGAERVIAIDRVPERLRMAEQHSKAETINFDDVKVYDRLMELTSGRGPDRCIDAVGAEAHGSGSFDAIVDKAKAAVMLGTDRPHVLREAIMCCRKAGTIPVPGVYIGLLDKIPFGAAIRAAPAVPWLSAFPELNVRTYVRAADRPGVYFFSLDAGRRLAVAAARASLICPTMPPP